MSATHDVFDELAPVYAAGALDGQDLARFQAHLADGCAACDRLLREYREVLAAVAQELRQEPPGRVREALVARMHREKSDAERAARAEARSRSWAAFRWVASVAVAAGLIASVVSAYVSSRYEARLGQMAREAAGLREQMAAQRQLLSLLQDPATRVVMLTGLPPSPQAQARMIWHDHAGGVLVAADLPRVPAGKTYEVWAIVQGKPIPAGLFTVDVEGRGNVQVKPLPGTPPIDRFAVTLEPAGGVPAPTGPIYLASQ